MMKSCSQRGIVIPSGARNPHSDNQENINRVMNSPIVTGISRRCAPRNDNTNLEPPFIAVTNFISQSRVKAAKGGEDVQGN
jgi:hypothetical protein